MKIKCNNCKDQVEVRLSAKLVPVPAHLTTDPRLPRYHPMIKATCKTCEKYIKFVKQTQDVIDEVNEEFYS